MLNDPTVKNMKNFNSRPSANYSQSPQTKNLRPGVMLPLEKQALSNNTTSQNQMSLMKGKKMTLINTMTDQGRALFEQRHQHHHLPMSQQNLEYAELLEMAKKRNEVSRKRQENDDLVLKKLNSQKNASKSFSKRSKKAKETKNKNLKHSKMSQDNEIKQSKESSLDPRVTRQKTPSVEDQIGLIDSEN